MIDYVPLTLEQVAAKFKEYEQKGDLRAFWETLRVLNEQRSIRSGYDRVSPLSIAMLPIAFLCAIIAIFLPRQQGVFRIVAVVALVVAVLLRIYWYLREKKAIAFTKYRVELDKLAIKSLAAIAEKDTCKFQPLHREQHQILETLLERTQLRPESLVRVLSLTE